MYQYFKKNTKGRDFVVGDIHGCFNMLQSKLYTVDFNEETDRLFATGDCCDRGPDHYLLLDYLKKPWFHSVRGNHEQMLIEAMAYRDNREALYLHYHNGGQWFWNDLTDDQRMTIAIELNKLPYQIEVETDNGFIGIIHADVPFYDWVAAHEAIGQWNHKAMANAIWSRSRFIAHLDIPVKNIDAVYVGHNVVKNHTQYGNVHLIDGGMGFDGGKCILVQIQ